MNRWTLVSSLLLLFFSTSHSAYGAAVCPTGQMQTKSSAATCTLIVKGTQTTYTPTLVVTEVSGAKGFSGTAACKQKCGYSGYEAKLWGKATVCDVATDTAYFAFDECTTPVTLPKEISWTAACASGDYTKCCNDSSNVQKCNGQPAFLPAYPVQYVCCRPVQTTPLTTPMR